MIPQTTELSQIQAAFIDKDNRIEELMRQINSAQSLLNSLKETINNGTLTIQKNGTSVGTFTANQSGDTTANISVPTATSELNNDSDFVSDANYVHTDNNFTNADKAEIEKINNSLQFTYVVDSNQKLADWANNVAGNDYTSVLIKKSSNGFNLPNNVALNSSNTLLLMGEAGAAINITHAKNASILRNIKEICFLTINLSWTAMNATSNQALFYQDGKLHDLVINIDYYNPNSYGSYFNIFNTNEFVRDCTVTITTHDAQFNANLFRYQSNCQNININISGNHTGGNFICIQGVGNGKNFDKIKVVNSGSLLPYGVSGVLRVTNCIMSGFTNPYNSSYSSPTADANYLCANTLEGGWNQ